MPVLLFCILVCVAILRYKMHSVEKEEQKLEQKYKDLEKKAALPISRDISQLPFITIHLEQLPFSQNPTGEFKKYETTILDLSKEKICNLNHMSNTDLRLTYGAKNFKKLAAYDQNYNILLLTLANWGTFLYEKNLDKEACMVLNYAVSLSTDIRKTYTTLAKIYKRHDEINRIYELLSIVETIDAKLDLKKAIYDVLNEC